MNLTALAAFSDNYIWMLDDGARAGVVDPGEAHPVEAALEARGFELAGILVTHHHADHVVGVDALRRRLAGPVFGPARERIPAPLVPLAAGDTACNPFLRSTVPAVVQAAREHGAVGASAVAVFATLREWKNQFR